MNSQTAVQKPAKNFREFERENADVKKGEHIKAPLARYSVKAGFNPRDLEKAETQEKIAALQAAYEAGDFVPLIVVRMATDGKTAEIIDGECRYTAACQADKAMRARGEKGITEYEAIRFTGTEAQAKAMTITANSGEQLTPMEQADVVAWFQLEGYKRDEIAKHLGKGVSWIDRLISFSKLPEDLKQQVRDNKVSADEAVKYQKKHGADAVAKVQEKLEEAKAKGETKVTPKHDKKGEPEAEEKSAADAVRDEVPESRPAVTKVEPQPTPERGQTLPPQEKPAKLSKEDQAAQKHALHQYNTARNLACTLPDKIKFPRNLASGDTATIELTGAALKLLVELQKAFTAEIEEELGLNKNAA